VCDVKLNERVCNKTPFAFSTNTNDVDSILITLSDNADIPCRRKQTNQQESKGKQAMKILNERQVMKGWTEKQNEWKNAACNKLFVRSTNFSIALTLPNNANISSQRKNLPHPTVQAPDPSAD
jgi:hypothetical protein